MNIWKKLQAHGGGMIMAHQESLIESITSNFLFLMKMGFLTQQIAQANKQGLRKLNLFLKFLSRLKFCLRYHTLETNGS